MRAFVADSEDSARTSKVHVVSLPDGRVIDSLPALHNPDVAVSPDGSALYIVHTNLDVDIRDPARDELVIYDARSLSLRHKLPFMWRSLYNVVPAGPSLVFSTDGRFCHVNRTETLGDDAAHNTMLVYDVAAERFREQTITLPYQVTSYGPVPHQTGIFYALSGRLGEAVAFADPLVDDEPRQMVEFGPDDPMRFEMAGAVADHHEASVWVVSRPGLVLSWDVATQRMSEPTYLELPADCIVPLQAVLNTPGELVLGVSPREAAARGLAMSAFVYAIGRGALSLRACWPLDPPAERLTLTADGRQLVALSRAQHTLSVYDIATGELGTRVEVGASPVSVALAGDSW